MIMAIPPDDQSPDPVVPRDDLLNLSHAVSFSRNELTCFRYVARKSGRSVSSVVREVLFEKSLLEPWLAKIKKEMAADRKAGRSAWTYPAPNKERTRRRGERKSV